jgi:hypothetical protein
MGSADCELLERRKGIVMPVWSGWRRIVEDGEVFYRRKRNGVEETIGISARGNERGAWFLYYCERKQSVLGEAPSLECAWTSALEELERLYRQELDDMLVGSVGG